MTVTMNALVTELSKQVSDWKEFTASSGSTNTVVANAIAQEQDNFITSGSSGQFPSTVYVKTDAGGAGAAPEGEERYITSKATTTITTNATNVFSAAIAAGDIVEVHRLFTREMKEQAIQYACNKAFPAVYKEIQSRSIVYGDWLVNGGNFPKWSQTTYPDSWVVASLTCAKNTTATYTFGLPTEYSIYLSGAAGSLYQSTSQNNSLWGLAGKTVTLYAWGITTLANSLRLSIYDGTTTTYSNYHSGSNYRELLTLTATLADTLSSVKVSILRENAGDLNYVGRIHLIASGKHSYDITPLGLYQNTPTRIFRLIGADAGDEHPEANPYKVEVTGYRLSPNGTLDFTGSYGEGARFEIQGMGYLTTPTSLYGDSTTATSTEINDIDQEGQIVIAEAAKYLMMTRMHTSPIKERDYWREMMAYWDMEIQQRRAKYSMKALPIVRHG